MGTHPIFESDFDCLTECAMDEVRNLKRVAFDHYETGNVHFQDNMYEKAQKSYEKSLIVIAEAELIDLLPKVLNRIAECFEKLGKLEYANKFKKLEIEFYETVLYRHSLNMIDAEKETFKEIEDRAAQLRTLSKLCDENDCFKLALNYIAKAAILGKETNGSNSPQTREDIEKYEKMFAKAGAAQYQENLQNLRQTNPELLESHNSQDDEGLRRRSILKRNGSSMSFDTPRKKVHFPDKLPRYTLEKKSRLMTKSFYAVIWAVFVLFCLQELLPRSLIPISVQIKIIAVLVGSILLTY